MNKLLENYFVEKYPKLFRDMYGPMDKTAMHWGIQCADGWFFLLNSLCKDIQEHIDLNSKVPQVVFTTVKEKLGYLVVYHTGGDAYIKGMMNAMYGLSFYVCENCGKTSQNVGRTCEGWIQSLCIACALEYGKNIEVDLKQHEMWNKVVLSRKNPNRSWDTLADSLSTLPDIKKKRKK